MKMKKFQYKIVWLNGINNLDTWLNFMGEHGWELVCVTDDQLFLKRETS